MSLSPAQEQDEGVDHRQGTPEQEKETEPALGTAVSAVGKGEQDHDTAHANSNIVRLHGETNADFDGGSFHTEDVAVERAEGCEGCSGQQCVHATGVLVATYSVTTAVTLPSVNDFPDLTTCQRQRVQDAIDNVLRPHEEEHVRAFETYNGTTRQPFDVTLCRSDFDETIRSMFESEETSRRSSAQGASDALDPFHFDVDMDCEDEESTAAGDGDSASDDKAPADSAREPDEEGVMP